MSEINNDYEKNDNIEESNNTEIISEEITQSEYYYIPPYYTAGSSNNKASSNNKKKGVGKIIAGASMFCLVIILALIIAFTAFMVIGRIISGVHWITDIIGGALFSAGLVMMFYCICK